MEGGLNVYPHIQRGVHRLITDFNATGESSRDEGVLSEPEADLVQAYDKLRVDNVGCDGMVTASPVIPNVVDGLHDVTTDAPVVTNVPDVGLVRSQHVISAKKRRGRKEDWFWGRQQQ